MPPSGSLFAEKTDSKPAGAPNPPPRVRNEEAKEEAKEEAEEPKDTTEGDGPTNKKRKKRHHIVADAEP